MKPVIWAVLVVAFASRAEGNSAKGDNAAAFAALCQPIRLATSTPSNLHHQGDADSITATITAINLTVADDTFTKKIEHDKTWKTAPEEYKNARPGWDKYHDTWVTAKKEITGDNKHKYTHWNSFKGNKAAQEQVAHIAEEAFRIKSELEKLRAKLNDGHVRTALSKAIHGGAGDDTKNFVLDFGDNWVNRAKICSPTDAEEKQTKPGTSLLLDAICLRTTGPDSDASAGKACCDSCEETTAADKSAVAAGANFKAKWDKLVKACTALAPRPLLNSQSVAQAVATMSTALNHKTTTQTNHDNLLGSVDNSGSSGCTGNTANTGGKCVVYKAGLTAEGDDAVQWLKHLQTAAAAEEARHLALQGLESKAGKLEALNKTLERLFLALRSSAAAGNPTPATAPETTKSSKASKEEAEKECNEIGKEADCKANPKCTWNPEEKDETKKCTLSEEGKQPAENTAAGNQAGTDGKNTTGSNSFVINKVPLLLAVLLF
uniref:Variant surface glycoprotein 1125.314 n=1 Tax=Trypanosoma brucei TaxID=5691 RepID=A0A1J0R5K3_9TRYP|nr:variant surface glycoprotein 1125.314 [Trypanosoma brucei]